MIRLKIIVPLLSVLFSTLAGAETLNGLDLQHFQPAPAPKPRGLLLKPGDRLAICGDSITEQKMYSRLIEDYLTMCVPELQVSVRQYGWGGERAPGFLARMTNDCLRFNPTIATTCYGMNDHGYRRYEESTGRTYRDASTAIVRSFKANGARVVQGSPGCVGVKVPWAKGEYEEMNFNLCTLRNIGIEIADAEGAGFADVFWPMLTAGAAAQKIYRANYAIAGPDGVHPAWAGHMVMAYAFLKALGLDGDIGAFTVDLKRNTMTVSKGHELISAKGGAFEIRSSRYPFCGCAAGTSNSAAFKAYPVCDRDNVASDDSIRSAMTLVPFNRDLNRFMLVVKNGTAANYKITWGAESRTFTAGQLLHGVNLAEEFPVNPFTAAFTKVDAAIAAKQVYETRQIKELFRGPEAKADMEGTVAKTEQARDALAEAIKVAFVPVTHTVRITDQ